MVKAGLVLLGFSSHRNCFVRAEKQCGNFGEVGILKYLPLADIGQAGDSVSSVTLNNTVCFNSGLARSPNCRIIRVPHYQAKNAFPCSGAE
jgi:hypothetical protein